MCVSGSKVSVGRVAILLSIATLGLPAFAQAKGGTTNVAPRPRAKVVFSHPLPALDGNRLKTTVLEVNYGPGGSSMPHSHPCAVIGYVTQGVIRTQVRGQLETIIKTGESFYEAPDAVHLVSANASRTAPARFLAFFVCDHEAPLSSDVPSATMPGGK